MCHAGPSEPCSADAPAPPRARRARVAAFCLALAALAAPLLAGLAGCADDGGTAARPDQAAGTDQVVTTRHYLIVLNVVPPEEMYAPERAASAHPREGELILHGHMVPIADDSRHMETHIYDLRTGRAVRDLHPVVTVTDETTGQVSAVEMTEMQDVVVGPRDFHYGNNVRMPFDHRFTIRARIGADAAQWNVHLL